jgi:metallophosphoesterase superfamily enzyme
LVALHLQGDATLRQKNRLFQNRAKAIERYSAAAAIITGNCSHNQHKRCFRLHQTALLQCSKN